MGPATGDCPLLNTSAQVSWLIDQIASITGQKELYMDLEGKDLCRHGELYIVQIFLPQKKLVVLLDIIALGRRAFDTPGSQGLTTLKCILESPSIAKFFFDCRNDSDALFAHFGIKLDCVKDIQVAKAAHVRGKYLTGLGKCISFQGNLGVYEKIEFDKIKKVGHDIFEGTGANRFEIWTKRPLPMDLVRYCVADVVLLPQLWTNIVRQLDDVKRHNVELATRTRIRCSQHPTYVPNGSHKSIGEYLQFYPSLKILRAKHTWQRRGLRSL